MYTQKGMAASQNRKAQSKDWAFKVGSPARTPFGFAQGKLTLDPFISDSFFSLRQLLICRSRFAAEFLSEYCSEYSNLA